MEGLWTVRVTETVCRSPNPGEWTKKVACMSCFRTFNRMRGTTPTTKGVYERSSSLPSGLVVGMVIDIYIRSSDS